MTIISFRCDRFAKIASAEDLFFVFEYTCCPVITKLDLIVSSLTCQCQVCYSFLRADRNNPRGEKYLSSKYNYEFLFSFYEMGCVEILVAFYRVFEPK